ncbi:hypothetical protein M885DRAFT_507567 [Pelagophyceae sp. CCMP2097]|nr:hypothetical protein M885DRAFT_507567 [Pelagophyceae sp. CCMP2097]
MHGPLLLCALFAAARCGAQASQPSAEANYAAIDVSPAETAALTRALTRATGVYVNAPGRRRLRAVAGGGALDAARTVLVVSFNSAYFRFFENWSCHSMRLGLKYLAWPQERRAAERARAYLAARPGRARHGTLFYSKFVADQLEVAGGPATFRSANFNALSNFKLVILHSILRRGNHVWFSDVDVAFIHDPWVAMAQARDGLDCDYQFQPDTRGTFEYEEGGPSGNTGFHFLRARAKMTRLVAAVLSLSFGRRRFDDQANFWFYLHHLPDNQLVTLRSTRVHWEVAFPKRAAAPPPTDGQLRICPLPHATFPCGQKVGDFDYLVRERSALVHANWLVGRDAKRDALDKLGLWLISNASDWEEDKQTGGEQCRAFDARAYAPKKTN